MYMLAHCYAAPPGSPPPFLAGTILADYLQRNLPAHTTTLDKTFLQGVAFHRFTDQHYHQHTLFQTPYHTIQQLWQTWNLPPYPRRHFLWHLTIDITWDHWLWKSLPIPTHRLLSTRHYLRRLTIPTHWLRNPFQPHASLLLRRITTRLTPSFWQTPSNLFHLLWDIYTFWVPSMRPHHLPPFLPDLIHALTPTFAQLLNTMHTFLHQIGFRWQQHHHQTLH